MIMNFNEIDIQQIDIERKCGESGVYFSYVFTSHSITTCKTTNNCGLLV